MAKSGPKGKYLPAIQKELDEKKEAAKNRKLVREGKLPPPTKEVEEPTMSSAELNEHTEKELKVLKPEEITKMLSDFTRRDPFNLKGLNPRFRYRLLSKKEDVLDRQTARGWEIVTGPEAEKIALASKIKTRQGKVVVQGLVLAKIPIELYIAIRARLKEINQRVVGESSNSLRRDMGGKYSRNVEESLKVRDRGFTEQHVV